jgi:hypothetical protein
MYAELDFLFERGVPVKKFKDYVVDSVDGAGKSVVRRRGWRSMIDQNLTRRW